MFGFSFSFPKILVERRRLVLTVMASNAAALAVTAMATSFAMAQASPATPGALPPTFQLNSQPTISAAQFMQKLSTGAALRTSRVQSASARTGMTPMTLAVVPGSATAPEIVELARALKNDPDLIYEYVYNNIQTLPEAGSLKGPVGALVDGKGTATDQAELMVMLLQQAALTNTAISNPQYLNGNIWLTPAQLTAWLGTDSNPNSALAALNAGGAPVDGVTSVGGKWCMPVNWTWVQVKIGTGTYVFDPASKLSNEQAADLSGQDANCTSFNATPTTVHSYTRKAGVNLSTATGYTAGSTSFMGSGSGGAEQGATITGAANMPATVQNINRGNIRGNLTTYSNALVTWIRGNHATSTAGVTSAEASTADIIGGASINALPIGFQVRQASLPYQQSSTAPTALTDLGPLRSTLTMTLCPAVTGSCTPTSSNTAVLNSSDIYGHRLSLFTNSSNQVALTLDGAPVLAQDNSTPMVGVLNTPATTQPLLVSVQQPFHSGPDTDFLYTVIGNPYVIETAWGPTGRGMIEKHRKQLFLNNQANPSAPASEPILGESLAVLGYTWTAELSRADELTSQISSVELTWFHGVGLVGMRAFDASGNGSPYVDLPLNAFGAAQLINHPSSDSLTPTETAAYMTSTEIGSVLESGALEQTSGTPGGTANQVAVSTVKLLDMAVANHDTIYDLNTSTWAGAQSAFNSNYYAGDYQRIDCFIVPTDAICPATGAASMRVIAAGNGKQMVPTTGGGFAGSGFLSLSADSSEIDAIITGGLSGGFGTVIDSMAFFYGSTSQSQSAFNTPAITSIAAGFLASTSGASATGPGVASGIDPINMVDGAFTNDHTDLTVGSGAMPYGLNFERHYDSASRLAMGSMGGGWTHNWTYTAGADSDGFAGMGQDSPISGASAIATIYVLQDILNTQKNPTQPAGSATLPLDHIVVGVVAERWLMDQLEGNVVNVVQPGQASQFVKLASVDGAAASTYAYNPPLGSNATLSYSGSAYTLKTADQNVLTFNAYNATDGASAVASLHYAAGPTVSFTYSGAKLTSVANGMGRTLTLTYTGSLVTGVSDGVRSIGFGYDANSNLTSFTDPASNVVTYNYDSPGRLTQIYYPSFPTNAFITNAYDSLDRVKVQTDALGNVTNVYLAGYRTETDDPAGTPDILYFTPHGKTLIHIDAIVNPTTGKDETTTNTYDGIDRLTSTTMPEGNSANYTYDNADGVLALQNVTSITACPKSGCSSPSLTTSFTYDSTFQKVRTVTDANLNVTINTYDVAGGTGNLLETDQPAVGGVVPKTIYTYNARGQVLTKTDPVGKVTKMVYDTTTEELLSVTDDYATGAGHFNLLTQFAYDGSAYDGAAANAIGNVTSTTDPSGNVTTTNYDALRRVTQVTAPTATGAVTQTTYNPDGLVTQVQRATGNVGAPWQTSSSTWSKSGKKLTDTDPNGHVTHYHYDTLDRVDTVTDPVGRVTTFGYDVLSRQLTVTNTTVPAAPVTLGTVSYTANGKKQTFTDARGNLTTYQYDGFDRLLQTQYPCTTTSRAKVCTDHVLGYSDPDNYEAVNSYDANSNPLTLQRRDGTVITLTYDALNRPTQKTYSAGGTTTFYSYDLDGRPLSARYTSTSGPGVVYAYDTAGRVSSETSSTSSQSHAISFQYDANGNRTRETWPDALYVTYVYDALNRMTAAEENGATSGAGLLASYSYDALSERTGITRGNGTSTSYGYDAASRLTSLAHAVPSDATHAMSLTFGYTDANQLNSRANTNTAYDWTNRPSATVNKTFDGLNRDATILAITGGYDVRGNVTADGTRTFTYDADNKMTSVLVAASSTTATLSYDPLGRLQQDVDTGGLSATTLFLYEGSRLSAEYDGTGNLLRRYVHGPGTDEPIVWYEGLGTTDRRWLHADGQGSIVAQSNASGVMTQVYAYGAYGEPQAWGASRFQYTGQIALPELQLYYYKARVYDAIAGRFLQTDPTGYDGGANLYAYVEDDPLTLKDPTGDQAQLGEGDIRAQSTTSSGSAPASSYTDVIPTYRGAAHNIPAIATAETAAWNNGNVDDKNAFNRKEQGFLAFTNENNNVILVLGTPTLGATGVYSELSYPARVSVPTGYALAEDFHIHPFDNITWVYNGQSWRGDSQPSNVDVDAVGSEGGRALGVVKSHANTYFFGPGVNAPFRQSRF